MAVPAGGSCLATLHAAPLTPCATSQATRAYPAPLSAAIPSARRVPATFGATRAAGEFAAVAAGATDGRPLGNDAKKSTVARSTASTARSATVLSKRGNDQVRTARGSRVRVSGDVASPVSRTSPSARANAPAEAYRRLGSTASARVST